MVRINNHLLLNLIRLLPNDKGPVAVNGRVVLQVDLQVVVHRPQSHTKIESISKCVLLH